MTDFKWIQEMEKEGYIKDLRHFKLRAECFQDVLQLLNKMRKNLYGFKIEQDFFPDVDFEFITNLTSDEILAILMKQDDSHVMRETLKPFDEYTGVRERL
jgi:hypothetical protein